MKKIFNTNITKWNWNNDLIVLKQIRIKSILVIIKQHY